MNNFFSKGIARLSSLVIFFLVALVIVAVGLFIYTVVQKKSFQNLLPNNNQRLTLDQALGKNSRFPQGLRIAQVGKETIYGQDMNYVLYMFYYKDFIDKKKSQSDLIKIAMPKASTDSILLQAGEKQNYLKLSKSIYNYPAKNEVLRQQAISALTHQFEGIQETISGEALAIWFYNMEPPKIPVAQAEKIAKDKMDAIYKDLNSGKLTFSQAADQIRNDTTLKQIDPSYKGNAYFSFSKRTPGSGFFSHSQLDKVTIGLRAGEISPVIRVPDLTAKPQTGERFYTIIKVTERENPGKGGFATWLSDQRKNYPITMIPLTSL